MNKTQHLFGWDQEPAHERPHRLSFSEHLGKPGVAANEMAWELVRDPPKASDMALSRLAEKWRADLVENLRPAALCQRFPRIANRLALTWADQVLAKRVLDELVMDKRGHRQGFPKAVADELARLHADVRRRAGF